MRLSTRLSNESISLNRNHLEMVQEIEETVNAVVDHSSSVASSLCGWRYHAAAAAILLTKFPK